MAANRIGGDPVIDIDIRTNAAGLREIRALDGIGSVAMAVEHRRDDSTYWHLGMVSTPPDIHEPHLSYPEVATEAAATAWVRFLGELAQRAKQAVRPVWCPNDHRQTVADAAAHPVEVGLQLVSGGDE